MPPLYQQPCDDHIELRVKTERELAVMGQAMQNHVNSLKESSVTMSECTVKMEEAVDLLTSGRIELARQDERLKSGDKRFNVHSTIIGMILTMLAADTLFIVAVHGEKALKFIKW